MLKSNVVEVRSYFLFILDFKIKLMSQKWQSKIENIWKYISSIGSANEDNEKSD